MNYEINLLKGHGSENTFFIVDNMNEKLTDTEKTTLTQILCNNKSLPHFDNIDGVLYMEPGVTTPTLMRIYNADGSEALMCGNGMRLAGRWSMAYLQDNEIIVENVTHLNYNIKKFEDLSPNVFSTQINLPQATFDTNFIKIDQQKLTNNIIPGFDEEHRYTAINMPNPHIIALVDDINDDDLNRVGSIANSDKSVFPDGVNVSWLKIIDKNEIFVSTFERGVGLTNSCGTAMMASCITATLQNYVAFNSLIKVKNKGGYILAKIQEDFSSIMIGNATFLGTIKVKIEGDAIKIIEDKISYEEQQNYENLKK